MQRFEDYRLPDGLSAGDICSIESGSGGFGIVKILALEPGTVHIRLYKEKFASRPDLIGATGLFLGTVHDEDGFWCPLGEPAQCDVKVACVSVSVFDQKTMKPAVPPAVSYRDRRGR